jgi:hypothetical protein
MSRRMRVDWTLAAFAAIAVLSTAVLLVTDLSDPSFVRWITFGAGG